LKIKEFVVGRVRFLAGCVETLADMLSGRTEHIARYLFAAAEHSGETINASVDGVRLHGVRNGCAGRYGSRHCRDEQISGDVKATAALHRPKPREHCQNDGQRVAARECAAAKGGSAGGIIRANKANASRASSPARIA
jgi:hypothetical protein